MSQCPTGQYFSSPQGICVPNPSSNQQQTQQNQQQPKFGQTYFGGLLTGILGNLSLGFGQGAGQSLNPQQPQVFQQPPRDNTIVIVIIAVVVVGIVILMNRKK
jgi:hypothetical protein